MQRSIDTEPRTFHLVRHEDPSGVSGPGVVAEGAVWSSGAVALHWPGYPRATSVWASLAEVLAAHGHNGKTTVKWLDGKDDPVLKAPTPLERDGRGWPVLTPHDPGTEPARVQVCSPSPAPWLFH